MLDSLIKFLNTLVTALPQLYSFYRNGKHEDKIVELFESYFILTSLTQTADELISLARGRDILVFSELSDKELQEHYSLIQSHLTIQLQRLQRLGDIFMSNPTIDLLDSKIKSDLNVAIGDKEKGLYNLGAGLFFNQVFGSSRIEGESESLRKVRIVREKYEFAASITKTDSISVKQQTNIVTSLKILSEKYRALLEDIAEPEHKTLLASKAKELADKYSVRL